MPLKPNENESDADFVTRASKDEEMIAKHPNQADRLEACQEILKEVRKAEEKSEPVPDIERRTILSEDLEMRIEDGDEAKLLTGYAAKFNKLSEVLFWFREKIAPGAFTDALKTSDVRALKNHDPNLLLGRSTSGTLRLDENKTGLKFEIDIPDTNTGRDTAEEVRRGDITGCSFAFTVDEESWRFDPNGDGIDERTIIKIRQLFDIGPVTYPAYPDTSVAARDVDTAVARRSRDAFKAAHKQTEEHKEHPEEKPEDRELEQKKEPYKPDFETRDRIKRAYKRAGRMNAAANQWFSDKGIERNKPADADLSRAESPAQ